MAVCDRRFKTSHDLQRTLIVMAIPAMEMILPQTSGGNTPAFLAKLWKMVNNPEIGESCTLYFEMIFSFSIFRSLDLLV